MCVYIYIYIYIYTYTYTYTWPNPLEFLVLKCKYCGFFFLGTITYAIPWDLMFESVVEKACEYKFPNVSAIQCRAQLTL